MASSVVLKVIAPPPVAGQRPNPSSELPCNSNGSNGPSSCDPPALDHALDHIDSPIPLEATPLPLFSPKLANVLENVLENGLAPCSNEEQEQQQQQQEEESTEIALKENQLLPLPSLPDVGHVLTEAIPIEISPPLAITQPPEAELLAAKSPEETKASPPSLHANEEMLDEDSEDELMETAGASSQPAPAIPAAAGPLNSDPLQASSSSSLPPSNRSDSTSPYADDESFAMFVAQEANETASALTLDPENSSLSPSPTPTPTPDPTPLPTDHLLPYDYLSTSGNSSALVQQCSIAASCHPTSFQLTEGASPAPLDMTAHNFPKRSKYAHRAAISAMHPYNRTRGGGGASVAKTLDLLKAVLQPSFNMEVKRLCDDYTHIYAMAASNIRENTGDTVPQSTLKLLIMKMIEEANQGYINGKWDFPSAKLPANDKVTAPKGSPMETKKQNKSEKDTRYPTKRQRKPPSDRQSDRPSGWRWGMDRRRLAPGKWDPDKLNLETDFVLGVNVNKALGHAANRGKVYYLHPELFKYACDGDDKTWLYENKHLPVHGGKAFLMIYSEVLTLIQTESCYKDNAEISNDVLKLEQFSVPQFMIDKMKKFMRSVQGYFTQESSQTSNSSSTSTVSKS